MKKTFLICVLIVVIACAFTACTGSAATVDRSWASNETISFSMYDSNVGDQKVGNVTMTTTTDLTEEEKNIASNVDTKVVISLQRDNVCTMTTTYYTQIQKVRALERTYTVLSDDETERAKSYTLKAHHEKKNYVYELTYPNAPQNNKSGKINVGDNGYTDNEFIYFYVRCYDVSSVPSSIMVADPFTDTSYKLTCAYTSNAASIKAETDKLGTAAVICNAVTIKRADTPVGTGITVYYLPDKSEYTYGNGSIIKSKKFPVQIVENNMKYVLNDFTAAK